MGRNREKRKSDAFLKNQAEIEGYAKQGEYLKAYECLRFNLDSFYEEDPVYAISEDIALLCAVADFSKARFDLEEFENRPYVSQLVEETLKESKRTIEEQQKRFIDSFKPKKALKIEAYSPSLSDEKVSEILSRKYGKGKDAEAFYTALLLDSSRSNLLRTGGLIGLMEIGSEQKVEFSKNGTHYSLIPSTLTPPAANETFAKLAKAIEKKKFKEFGEIPFQMLLRLEVASFPRQLDKLGSNEGIEEALCTLCKVLFRQETQPKQTSDPLFLEIYSLVFETFYDSSKGVAEA